MHYLDKQAMEYAICQENRNKYHQTEATCPLKQHPLKEHFEDIPPIFKNVEITRNDIGDHMKDFCEETGF